MTTYMSSLRQLATNTPPERNRVVDLLRVVSILVVVFGHWLIAAVRFEDGSLVAGHLLDLTTWTHPLTWILQVMPVFFLVGGYSNALSWRSARRRGETYGAWLRSRLRRLTLPVVPLLLVWGVGAAVALQLGADSAALSMSSQVAFVPTWFLATYVVIVALAPGALALWERFGWWSIGVGAGLAALVDTTSLALNSTAIGLLNYVLVWGVVHQLGYAWVDGRIPSRRGRLGMAVAALAGLTALVSAGPYAVAMVSGAGDGVANTFPPRVTLIFLGVFQAGVVLWAEPVLRKFATRPLVWTGVVAVSAQIMTLYLWHLTAMVAVVAAATALGGFGLGVVPTTGAWWLTRPIWFAVLALVTSVLVVVFGRFERPGADPRSAPGVYRPLLAVLGTCVGLGLLARGGVADSNGLNGLTIALPIVAMSLGGVIGATKARRRA